jgi:hypothetical protein
MVIVIWYSIVDIVDLITKNHDLVLSFLEC